MRQAEEILNASRNRFPVRSDLEETPELENAKTCSGLADVVSPSRHKDGQNPSMTDAAARTYEKTSTAHSSSEEEAGIIPEVTRAELLGNSMASTAGSMQRSPNLRESVRSWIAPEICCAHQPVTSNGPTILLNNRIRARPRL